MEGLHLKNASGVRSFNNNFAQEVTAPVKMNTDSKETKIDLSKNKAEIYFAQINKDGIIH